jgi:serine/threonine-protein kinase
MTVSRDDLPAPIDSNAATVTATTFDETVAEAAAQLTAAWDVRGIDIATVQFDKGTVVDRSRPPPMSTRVGTLPVLLAPGPSGARPQFEMGDVLGEGGMGVVRLAQQLALRREVAVKTLKPEARHAEVPQLLREARVTGVLEHPNVVPIYALGRDNEDRPLIVMKRISGHSWRDELEHADARERLSDAYLRKHLAILEQVARAAHFAHKKGILHRDLKPENVMIGDFGEVYLVDWGIAVSLADDVPGVPYVKDVTAIEGTPGYMAPEMAAADGELIDQRSDVYLLGAILHEIVTGDPPHRGKTVVAVLTNAFASVPHDYGEEVPVDLARICRRAMARHREERYADASAFADALNEFMVHRSSTMLSDEAAIRLREASELLGSTSVDTLRESEQLYAKFGECRFAFTQALKSWPENRRAEDGLQETLELMIEHELSRDAPRAARALVLQLPRDNAELRERVADAMHAKEHERARLAQLERDKDTTIGAGKRRLIGAALGSVWGLVCIGSGVLTRTGVFEVTHTMFAAMAALLAAGTIVTASYQKETLLTTDYNRRLAVFTTLVFTAYAGLWTYAGLIGLAKAHTTILHSIITVALWMAAGLTHNRLWLTYAYGGIATIVLVLAWPAYHWELMGLASGLASALVSYRTGEPRSASAAD